MRNKNLIFGKRVKEAREKLGISREDFAKQNHISYSALSMYERGERSVSDEIKIRIAKSLNISLDYLIGIINEPIPYTDVESYLVSAGGLIDSKISDERIQAIVKILINNKDFIDILEKQYKEEKDNQNDY